LRLSVHLKPVLQSKLAGARLSLLLLVIEHKKLQEKIRRV
jgi:hypothetical protein